MAKLQEFTLKLQLDYWEILSCKNQNQAVHKASELRLSVEKEIRENLSLKHNNMFLEDFFCESKIAEIMTVVESLSLHRGRPKFRTFEENDKTIFESQKVLKPYKLRSDQYYKVLLENCVEKSCSRREGNNRNPYPVVLGPKGDKI